MDATSQGFQCISGRVPIGTSKFHYREAGSNAKGMSKLLYRTFYWCTYWFAPKVAIWYFSMNAWPPTHAPVQNPLWAVAGTYDFAILPTDFWSNPFVSIFRISCPSMAHPLRHRLMYSFHCCKYVLTRWHRVKFHAGMWARVGSSSQFLRKQYKNELFLLWARVGKCLVMCKWCPERR